MAQTIMRSSLTLILTTQAPDRGPSFFGILTQLLYAALMTLFRYTALTEEGMEVKGELEAETLHAARRQLQGNSMYATRIINAEGSFSFTGWKARLEEVSWQDVLHMEIGPVRIPQRELVAFTRQFATLVQAGIPIIQALDSLIDQSGNKGLARVLKKIRHQINEGQSLAQTMEPHRVFSSFYTNMVMAAEATGRLGPVMEELADLLEERQKLSGQIRGALTYPVFMLVLGGGVIVFLLTNVVPNITAMFAESGQQLPPATRFLLDASSLLRHHGFALVLVLLGAGFLFSRLYQKTPALQKNMDYLLLKLPAFGALAHKTALARFSGTLASLLKAGVPIITALRITTNITPFAPYKEALEETTTKVGEGVHLGHALKEANTFPAMLTNMVNVGEQAGTLDTMLQKVADTYAHELRTSLSAATSLVQPLLLLLIGAMIAFIMVAILMPIFELNTIAGGL